MEKIKQTGSRKRKVLYKIWLTTEEERLLSENFTSLPSLVWGMMKRAYNRGDFEKYIKRSYSKSKNSKGTIKSRKQEDKLENDN